jgi:hypothetical protein
MRLKEVLAKKYVNYSVHILPENISPFLEDAWLSGFETCRKMALMPEHGYEGPFISGSSVEELGEKEV